MARKKATASKDTKVVKGKHETNVYDYVSLKELPNFADLNEKVTRIIESSSAWEIYGIDWMILITAFFLVFVAMFLLRSSNFQTVLLGVFLMGCCHSTICVKSSHSAVHGALCKNKTLNKILVYFLSDVCSSVSAEVGYDVHIRIHHPHTNIIGLGDSSTWKMPFLPSYIYMFIAPLLLPVVAIPIVIQELWGKWKSMLIYFILMPIGLAINFYLLMRISGFTFWGAVMITLVYRATLSIPYIHVGIFQHIGLAMYSKDSRPKRIYQMSTGVLNLPRNVFLDYTFGHSIVSCHVEHHLFPKLSDNMCLKVKPVVSKFLLETGLLYYEDTYMNRLGLFIDKYNDLMVNAPPISHFVGIQ